MGGRRITFKVWIPGYGRRVWRHIHIPESETLDVLAIAIIDAYGFDGDPTHLYKFYFTEKPWDPDQVAFVHPKADGMKADKMKLSNLHLSPGQTFNLLYDFGDEWRFKVKMEGMTEGGGKISVSSHGEAPEQYPLAPG